MEVVIVSRHESTINYLKKYFPEARVLSHVGSIDEIPKASLVIGNLPLSMIDELVNKKGCRVVVVSLNVPRDLRGQELNEDQLKEFMKLYEVSEIKLTEFILV